MGLKIHFPSPGDIIKKIKDAAEGIEKSIISSIQNAGKAVLSSISKAETTAVAEVKHELTVAEGTLDTALSKGLATIKEEVGKVDDAVGDAIKGLPEKIKQELEEAAGKALDGAISHAHTYVSSLNDKLFEAKQKRPDLIEDINKVGFGFGIGPVKMSFSNFENRGVQLTDALDDLTKKKITFTRKDIKEVITALGPDDVSIGGSVNLAALIVESDALGVDFEVTGISSKLIADLIDDALERLGVPE